MTVMTLYMSPCHLLFSTCMFPKNSVKWWWMQMPRAFFSPGLFYGISIALMNFWWPSWSPFYTDSVACISVGRPRLPRVLNWWWGDWVEYMVGWSHLYTISRSYWPQRRPYEHIVLLFQKVVIFLSWPHKVVFLCSRKAMARNWWAY